MRLLRHGLFLSGRVLTRQPGRPWLVSLHGFMQSGDDLAPVLGGLSGIANILTLDLVGHGRSQRCEDPARFDSQELVEDVHAWIDRLQLAPCFLHGYSLGGRLAWNLLHSKEKPSRRWSGVIIESGHPGYATEGERAERRSHDASLADMLESDWQAFIRTWSSHPLLGPFSADPTRAGCFAACLKGFGTGTMPPAEPLDRMDEGEATAVPLLAMAGELDPDYAERLRSATVGRPNARCEIIDGARHRIWQDRPDAWIHSVSRFIMEHSDPGRNKAELQPR
jgi:2-succinyl-6-hydroxy-2,4-cyclohexadiene-1-carboxylate synthase